jgi:hypothetical protein
MIDVYVLGMVSRSGVVLLLLPAAAAATAAAGA